MDSTTEEVRDMSAEDEAARLGWIYRAQLAGDLANPPENRHVNTRTNRRLISALEDERYGTAVIRIPAGTAAWIWSDQHVGHDNVIRHCDRPFADGEEMDDALLTAWERLVGATDTVICVGDVQVAWARRGRERIAAAPGRKILILGNHDFDRKGKVIQNAHHEVYAAAVTETVPRLWLSHMPLYRPIPQGPEGSVNVHGHVHNNVPLDGRRINVSVEYTDYRPLRLEQVTALAAELLAGRIPDGEDTAERCEAAEKARTAGHRAEGRRTG